MCDPSTSERERVKMGLYDWYGLSRFKQNHGSKQICCTLISSSLKHLSGANRFVVSQRGICMDATKV